MYNPNGRERKLGAVLDTIERWRILFSSLIVYLLSAKDCLLNLTTDLFDPKTTPIELRESKQNIIMKQDETRAKLGCSYLFWPLQCLL